VCVCVYNKSINTLEFFLKNRNSINTNFRALQQVGVSHVICLRYYFPDIDNYVMKLSSNTILLRFMVFRPRNGDVPLEHGSRPTSPHGTTCQKTIIYSAFTDTPERTHFSAPERSCCSIRTGCCYGVVSCKASHVLRTRFNLF
jgi:hypothetical protein